MRHIDITSHEIAGRAPPVPSPGLAGAALGALAVVAEAQQHALLRVTHLQWRAAQRLRAARSPAQALHLQADLLAEGLDTLALCAREHLKAWVDAHQAAVAAPRIVARPPAQEPHALASHAPTSPARRARARRIRPASIPSPRPLALAA